MTISAMIRRGLGLTALIGVAAACGDSLGLALSDLRGTWLAVEVILTDVESGEEQRTNPNDGGGEVRMTIGGDGMVIFVVRESSEFPPDTSLGAISVEGDRITLVLDGDTMTGTALLEMDRLTSISTPSMTPFSEP